MDEVKGAILRVVRGLHAEQHQWKRASMGELAGFETTLTDGRTVTVAGNGLGIHVEVRTLPPPLTTPPSGGPWAPRLADTASAFFVGSSEVRAVKRVASRQVRAAERAARPSRAERRAAEHASAAAFRQQERESAQRAVEGL